MISVEINFIDDSLTINNNGVIEICSYSECSGNEISILMDENDIESIICKMIDNSESSYFLITRNIHDECGTCHFNDKDICPKCIGVNFFKLPKDYIRSVLSNLLCNEDACVYYNSCESAPLCLINKI